LEARKSKRETEKTKQKQENTQNTQATKGGRKTKPERGKEQRPRKRERSGFWGGGRAGQWGPIKARFFFGEVAIIQPYVTSIEKFKILL